MKKIIPTIALGMTLMAQTAFGAGLGADAVFSTENATLTISGTGSAGSEVTVVVLPYDSNPAQLTPAVAGTEAVFNMAHTDKDGKFSIEMGLRTDWEGGMYKALVYQSDDSTEIWFSYADVAKAEEYLDDINKATATGIAGILKSNASDLGAEPSLALKYASTLGGYLYNNRPEGGYTADGFLNEYTAGLALAMVRAGDASLGDTLGKFSKYIGVDVESDYNAYTVKVRKELERLVQADSFEEGNAEEIYRKNLLIARVNKADSDSELQTVITENKAKLGISFADYDDLVSSYKKLRVFAKMLGDTHSSYEEIADAFDDAVDYVMSDDGSSSGGGGGSSSGGGSGISGGSLGGGSVTNTPAKENNVGQYGFSDMSGHWAQDKVNALAALGIVNGYNDGTFLPEKKVTRAEFSKMLCLTLGLEGDSYRADYADVTPTDWYAPYVLALSGDGIVTGYNGYFNPNDEITRQDAAVMTWRALWKKGVAKGSTVSFADDSQIASYAKDSVAILGGLGVINGYNGSFNPAGNTTRAETASILNNVLAIIR